MSVTQAKRRQIIDAAVAEFREKGFAGASMDRVSARAEVSKRTVYNHFESKDALFRAILDVIAERIEAEPVPVYDPARPLRAQLLALAWVDGRLLIDPDFMKLARMVVGEIMRDPQLAARTSERLNRKRVFRTFIADAAAAGALSMPDPDRGADQILGLIKAQGFWPMVMSGSLCTREEMTQVIETSVDMFLDSYRP